MKRGRVALAFPAQAAVEADLRGTEQGCTYKLVCVYIYIYVYVYVCVYIHIYVYFVGLGSGAPVASVVRSQRPNSQFSIHSY